MLNIRRRDIHNEELRTVTKVRDANDLAWRAKHCWAGHICRLTDYRWTRTVTEWFLPKRTDAARRPLGRPPTRWSDEIRTQGPTWMQKARLRMEKMLWPAATVSDLKDGPFKVFSLTTTLEKKLDSAAWVTLSLHKRFPPFLRALLDKPVQSHA